MSLDSIVLDLASAYDKAANLNAELDKEIQTNHKTYTTEYVQAADTATTDKFKQQITSIYDDAAASFDAAIKAEKQAVASGFASTITADTAAELDQVGKTKPTMAEMRVYLDKFKDNQLALRRLTAIAEENGYAIAGPTFEALTTQLAIVENDGKSVLSSIQTAQPVYGKIALNLMTDHVIRLKKLQEAPFTVA